MIQGNRTVFYISMNSADQSDKRKETFAVTTHFIM